MKKKVIAGLLLSSCVLGVAMPAFAETKTVDGEGTTDILVNGTLGADNTDPEAEIPEGEEGWINVTVPTDVVFYNTSDVPTIKSPEYQIVNNSGRPVEVTLASFENDPGNGTLNPALPTDYILNLVHDNGTIHEIAKPDTTFNYAGTDPFITLPNVDGRQSATGTPVVDGNIAHFRFSGTADPAGVVQPKYTMTLKFTTVTNWN